MQRNAQRDHDEVNSSAGVTPPSINSLTRIRSSYLTLAVSEMRVVDWVMQQPEKIMQFSIAQVAQACRVSDNMLMRLRLNCKAQTDSYLQLMEVALLGTGDVVVAISQSGTSIDPVITLKQAGKNGAATICITGNAHSPITEHADATLLSVAREARIESIASRLAQLSIADALYVIIALGNIETTARNEQLIWDALLPKMY